MRREHGARRGRGGFTLIELLIVLAIISVLAALVAGASLRLVGSQEKANTRQLLEKLQKTLDQQWTAVADEARKQRIPDGVFTMAGGDVRRAKVIWLKLRLKQEFPQRFNEARRPSNAMVNDVLLNPANPYLTADDLPPRQTYASLLSGVTEGQAHLQTSVCLFLALSQTRRGMAANLEEGLGAGVLRPLDATAAEPTRDRLRYVADAYGSPVVFVRWPTGGAETSADAPEPDPTPGRDPSDPEGSLLDPSWNNPANYNARQGVYWFERLCHPVHQQRDTAGNWVLANPFNPPAGPVAATNYRPWALDLKPTLVSAGPNKQYGINFSTLARQFEPGSTSFNHYNDNIQSTEPR